MIRAGWSSPARPSRKLNAVDPQRHFTGLFTRPVNGWPNGRSDDLMPWCSAESVHA